MLGYADPKKQILIINCAAAIAKREILFFLHADTSPPDSFLKDIEEAVCQGYSAGSFRLSFDHDHWFLQLNCWFTRFNFTPFRFGDRGLFVLKDTFKTIGGFAPDLRVLEDQEIVKRIKRAGRFKIFDQAVITSARKYLQNGIFRLQLTFILMYFLYQFGLSQERLIRIYNLFILDEKLNQKYKGSKESRILNRTAFLLWADRLSAIMHISVFFDI